MGALKTKKNNSNQLKEHWKRKNELSSPTKDRVENDEDGIGRQDALMDKEQRLAERAQNCGARRGYRETASKLADKTRELNARKKT